MFKYDLEYRDFSHNNECWCSCRPRPCSPCSHCCTGPRGADGRSAYEIAIYYGFTGTEIEWLDSLKGDTGPTGPFLSSYVEAVGTTQNIGTGANFVFDFNPDYLDMVGQDIQVNTSGTTFTILRPGLYRVEWSMNITSGTTPVIVGLLENGEPASGLTNSSAPGNHSSGALINVEANEVPYVVSLHNFGPPVSIDNPPNALNTAVSIRISRFADGHN